MAFFGLTALGPQSSFASEYKNGFTVALFSEDEFGAAYDAYAEKRGGSRSAKADAAAAGSVGSPSAGLTLGDVEGILALVFHGPPPEGEAARALRLFTDDGKRPAALALSRELFLAGVATLQERAQEDGLAAEQQRAAHYTTFGALREHRKRHVAAVHGPADTFARPVTLSHDIGWRGYEMPADKRHPKKHCAETVFMSLLRASGYL